MLLEYFMSSGQAGSLEDARINVSSTNTTIEKPAIDNNVEFKNALSNSISNRAQYLNNQSDRIYSESNLISSVKHWDALYTQTDIDTDSTNTTSDIESSVVTSGAVVADTGTVDKKLAIGDIVPTKGKELPDNKELITNNVRTKDVISGKSSALTKSETLNSQTQETATKSVINNVIPSEDKQLTEKAAQTISELKSNTKETEKLITTTTNSSDYKKEPQKILAQETILKSGVKSEQDSVSTHKPTTESEKPTKNITAANNNILNTNRDAVLLKDSEPLVKEPTFLQKPKTLLSETTPLPSKQEAPVVNSSVSSVTDKSDQTKHNLQGKFTLESKFGNNTPAISVVKEQNNLKIQLLDKENSSLKTETLVADIVKNKQSKSTVVPESNRSELINQLDNQSQNLNKSSIAEQLMQQNMRNNSATNIMSNHYSGDSSTSATTGSKVPEILINDVVTTQNQQISNNQNTIRATDIALPVSVPTQKWNQKFAEHVSMLTLRGSTNAQIRLDPPELGPMSIRINHQANETQIQFVVNNPIARELVDSGTQRLREMLEQHGFDNVDVDVNEFTKGEQRASAEDNTDHEIDNLVEEQTPNSETLSEINTKTTLIDLFA